MWVVSAFRDDFMACRPIHWLFTGSADIFQITLRSLLRFFAPQRQHIYIFGWNLVWRSRLLPNFTLIGAGIGTFGKYKYEIHLAPKLKQNSLTFYQNPIIQIPRKANVSTSGLCEFFCHGTSIVAACWHLGSTRWTFRTFSMTNWRPSSVELSSQYLRPSTFDQRPLNEKCRLVDNATFTADWLADSGHEAYGINHRIVYCSVVRTPENGCHGYRAHLLLAAAELMQRR